MPIAPAIRRDRYRYNHQKPKAQIFEKRRCMNCGKFFPMTKPNRKFCGTPCQQEFAHYGSAFGKLKLTLEELTGKWTRATLKAERERHLAAVERLENAIEHQKQMMDGLYRRLKELELETHPAAITSS